MRFAALRLPHRTFGALAFASLWLLPALAAASGEATSRRPRNELRVVTPDEHRAMTIAVGRRGFLGVHVLELTAELRRHFGAGEEAGVLISRIEEGSPAEQAGVEVGDVLVAIDGEPVRGAWDLRRLVGAREQGATVSVEVVRDRRRRVLAATLEERQGKLLELGELLRRDAEGRPLLVLPSSEEWGMLGEQLGELGEEVGEAVAEAMASPQVRLRIEREVREREVLQRQIERLEQRLKELERRLAEQRR